MAKRTLKSALRRGSYERTPATSVAVENLENRQLLSVSHLGSSLARAFAGGLANFGGGGHGNFSPAQRTITANLLPGGSSGAAATELDTLSGTTLTDTSTIYLGNSNGVETYSVRSTTTGTRAVYTVDISGAPVTAPTFTTTTFQDLPGPVSGEFSTIASDAALTAPALTASVNVNTATSGPKAGSSVYTLFLSSSSGWGGKLISIDDAGNPVGNGTVPFEALSTALQTALDGAAPAGASPLSDTSTQNVRISTVDGVTLYSVRFTGTGVSGTATVTEAAQATDLPNTTTTTLGVLDPTVAGELQTLATADGYTGTLDGTTTVTQYNEANSNVVYAVSVPLSKTGNSGDTYTINITVAADAAANPTVPPGNGLAGFLGNLLSGFGFAGGFFG